MFAKKSKEEIFEGRTQKLGSITLNSCENSQSAKLNSHKKHFLSSAKLNSCKNFLV